MGVVIEMMFLTKTHGLIRFGGTPSISSLAYCDALWRTCCVPLSPPSALLSRYGEKCTLWGGRRSQKTASRYYEPVLPKLRTKYELHCVL